ncbi:hypothetical protein H0I23_11135 [Cellulophaga sp. HaHaR_3_176]|uniref:imm11 family protein n=1 Tax=Cellulophaga sp. HaHaR_3_176 TaxID=1942464 RepID=UPI001C20095B|nr:DUF1629 domain-containing protein [Cellulophaga sp. HaHaR_3_176]QWX83014.1 hypothetical protein H0I23_11135 [Cellulophaga sp. HaHaR_3_176]
MKFYKIRPNAEIVGEREVYPSWEYDANQENSETKLEHTTLPNFKPVFSNVYINRLTDVMFCNNIGGKGFIVSEKLKKLLAKHNIDTHRFYNLNLFYYDTKKQVLNNYYWFQIVSTNFLDWIDYNNSKFYLFDDFEENKVMELDLKNKEQLAEEVKNTMNTDNIVIYEKLTFNSNFKNLDFFYMDDLFDNLFNYPIVSEKLMYEIEKNNIQSFEFKEVNIVKN